MAFDINNFGRWSVSYNSTAPNYWGYNGDKGDVSDNLDVITASGYFDAATPGFLRPGDLIYITAVPIAPILPFNQTVAVRSLNPVVIEPINGVTPIVTVVITAQPTIAAVGLIQIFNIPGILSTDRIVINLTVNPGAVQVLSAITGSGDFTLSFDINPGAGVIIDAFIFRQSFT